MPTFVASMVILKTWAKLFHYSYNSFFYFYDAAITLIDCTFQLIIWFYTLDDYVAFIEPSAFINNKSKDFNVPTATNPRADFCSVPSSWCVAGHVTNCPIFQHSKGVNAKYSTFGFFCFATTLKTISQLNLNKMVPSQGHFAELNRTDRKVLLVQ